MWTFSARNTGSIAGKQPDNQIHTWGGVSIFRFNSEGKIISEVGEESTPGPFERLQVKIN